MDLQTFYAELDKRLPDSCRTTINGHPVIISSLAYGKPVEYIPQTEEEWLDGVAARVGLTRCKPDG